MRGIVNEGGTAGERAGWHLPGADVSSWSERDPSAGLPDGGAGVGVFVTHVTLDLPSYTDAPLAIVFDDGVGKVEV